MLAYRHAFHAGNHADVLKHLVLLSVVEYLTHKETALLYVDTHAGAGAYRLDAGYANQNKEWQGGWQRLEAALGSEKTGAPALDRFLEAVKEFQASLVNPAMYPGSPVLVRRILRPQDYSVLCELHPTDHEILEDYFRGDRRVQVHKADGFRTLKGVLPPTSRRGMVLFDPSYEMGDDYTRLPAALDVSLERFATGCYLVWYPKIERPEAKNLPNHLERVAEKAGRPWLQAELSVATPVPGQLGMTGSGMFVINPPYVLADELRTALPVVQEILGPEHRLWLVIW